MTGEVKDLDFAEIYCHLAMSTGWTFTQIGEEFDIPRIEAMNRYWLKHPPVHVMIASYLGVKDTEPPPIVDGKVETTDKKVNEGLEAALQAFQMGAG